MERLKPPPQPSKKKKWMRPLAYGSSFLVLLLCSAIAITISADNEPEEGQVTISISGTNVNYPSQSQIAQFYRETAQKSMAQAVEYDTKPYLTSPYAPGTLSEDTQLAGIDVVNFVRYVAGLSYDVTLAEEYVINTQMGSLANALNNELTHYPDQPVGMSDDMFAQAEAGTGSSNLGQGYSNLGEAIVSGWMEDGDTSNIDRVGHRRWVINPTMEETCFGFVTNRDSFSAMYAFDGFGNPDSTTGVLWPAQNMPTILFGSIYPWSFSVGEVLEIDRTTVTMTRLEDGKVWEFDSSVNDKNGAYFNVENNNFGMKGCVIFRPDPKTITYQDGDTFHVEISTIGASSGKIEASYVVSFFDINNALVTSGSLNPEKTPKTYNYTPTPTIPVTQITLSKTELVLAIDGSATLTATITPSEATNQDLIWTSSDESVVAVDKGNLLPLSLGTATVTVTNKDSGVSASCQVKVSESVVGVESITLSPQTLTLEVGASSPLFVEISPYNAENQAVSWRTSDSTVATVTSNGRVYGEGGGTAIITVSSSDGGLTATCEVTVNGDPQEETEPEDSDTDADTDSDSSGDSNEDSSGNSDDNYNDSGTTSPETELPKEGTFTIFCNPTGGTLQGTEFITTNEQGNLSSLPTATRTGYRFTGWYATTSGGRQVDSSTIFSKNSTIYAQWVADSNGSPTDKVWPVDKFIDVDTSSWYFEPVKFLYEEGLMDGTGDDIFSPDLSTTRAMIVTILHKMAGNPAASGSHSFLDVPSSAYFNSAVTWAKTTGLSDGVSDEWFDADKSLTREELVVMLYSYEKNIENNNISSPTSTQFTDDAQMSLWAKEAIAWSAAQDYISGRKDGSFDPKAGASRAEVATILRKYLLNHS